MLCYPQMWNHGTMIAIYMIATPTFTCNYKVYRFTFARLERYIWRPYFGIINLHLNHPNFYKNINIILVQMTNTSHPHNKVWAARNVGLIKNKIPLPVEETSSNRGNSTRICRSNRCSSSSIINHIGSNRGGWGRLGS